ncbi:signal recognition particle protein Srp19 [Candidatus Bathyarchaeota archaeon]|nr:signal recognition particle protein Srp19 [Candidatus Bathyarchaeota archaeon]
MRGRGKLRIYPAYFDVRYSRGGGRRVPRSKAIRDPTADEIERAAAKLGLNPLLQPGAYSKHPWKPTGVVLVDKKGSKTRVIEQILGELKRQ